jgi:hypothetical protein
MGRSYFAVLPDLHYPVFLQNSFLWSVGMPGSGPDWGSDPVRTGLDPGSGQVQGPVQHLALGSGSGFGVGWVCCEPGLNRTGPEPMRVSEKLASTSLF